MKKKNISAKPGAAQPAPLSPPGAALTYETFRKFRADVEKEITGLPDNEVGSIKPLFDRFFDAIEVIWGGIDSTVQIISKFKTIDPISETTAIALQPLRCAAGIKPDFSLCGDYKLRDVDAVDALEDRFFGWAVFFKEAAKSKTFLDHFSKLKQYLLDTEYEYRKNFSRLCSMLKGRPITSGRVSLFFDRFEDIVSGGLANESEVASFAHELDKLEDILLDAKLVREKHAPPEFIPFCEHVHSEVCVANKKGQKATIKEIIDDLRGCSCYAPVMQEYAKRSDENAIESLYRVYLIWRKDNGIPVRDKVR